MVKRTRKEPSAEEMHYLSKKRRLADRDAASVTCRRNLFGNSGPPSIKKARKAAIEEFQPEINFSRLKKLREKWQKLIKDD